MANIVVDFHYPIPHIAILLHSACRYMYTSYVDLDLSVPVDSTLPVDLLVPTGT